MYSTAQAKVLHLAKFNANGTLDLTFNGGMGYRTISSPHKFVARSGLLQNDGKIVVASMGMSIQNVTKGIYINRFMANGDDDLSFGVNGEFSLLTNDSLKLSHIAFSNDLTKIILAGFVQKLEPGWGIMEIKEGFMMRLMTDTNIGVVDVEEKQASVLVFPNPTTERLVLNYTLQSETEVAISLRSLDGKVLQTYETMPPSKVGENKLDLTLPASLASGSYFLTLSTKMGIKSILITKI
jgi:hypothetical protein